MVDDVTNKKMVVGFLFSGFRVLLVQKIKPEWQAGLWNGVGGLIEPNETPLDAMRREFLEETKTVNDIEWRHFATEIEPFGAYVYFFSAKINNDESSTILWPSVNDVGEMLRWKHITDIGFAHMRCLGNLNWLLPLARDWRNLAPVIVDASKDIRERASW